MKQYQVRYRGSLWGDETLLTGWMEDPLPGIRAMPYFAKAYKQIDKLAGIYLMESGNEPGGFANERGEERIAYVSGDDGHVHFFDRSPE